MRSHMRLLLPCYVCPVVILFGALTVSDNSASATKSSRRDVIVRLPAVCGAALANPRIDGSLPPDVEGALLQKNRSVVQRAADIFSWQEFLALNWPARSGLRGEANLKQSIGASGPRVWETWKENREVYLPDGAPPPDWNTPSWTIDARSGLKLSGAKRSEHILHSVLQAVQSDGTLLATLTDRHGHLVRYEVRMNRVMFDFIRNNRLFDARRHAETDVVSFPNGSMLVKASWRELEPGEGSRFLTTDALLYDVVNGKAVRRRRRKMGLIGLHIVQKTPSAPQWLWSTFEQVDNIAGPHPSFKSHPASGGRANAQTRPGTPNMVTRALPISSGQADCSQPAVATDNVRELNLTLQRALASRHSVLQYYELVNTQWPLPRDEGDASTAKPPATVFRTLPAVVGNTTMETFAQDTSSCMGCHAMARTKRTDRFVSADFTFTLDNARPELPNTQILEPARQPKTDWDRQNWPAILRGKNLTEHTYELLPQFAHAKLHCESCHLDAGRNPASAWWVGMFTKYPSLEKMQARINQCFERSMNGNPISTAKTESELPNVAPDMHAFFTYIQWLDEQYQAKSNVPAKNGLAVLPKLSGDLARGKEIFLQKCAACHGKEGQGRYESKTYYRPALWGSHSFNTLAGMNKPEKLSGFLKTNMPFGSGGVLTVQESWDLAAFLINQRRPIKDPPKVLINNPSTIDVH